MLQAWSENLAVAVFFWALDSEENTKNHLIISNKRAQLTFKAVRTLQRLNHLPGCTAEESWSRGGNNTQDEQTHSLTVRKHASEGATR